MIQRIQTVWWLLSAILLVGMLFLPVFRSPDGTLLYPNNFVILLLTALVTAGGSLLIIFLYKNRPFQIKAGWVLILLHLLLMGILGYWFFSQTGLAYLPATVIPLISLIFQILAIRGVRKDEALVKSMDRLR
ncbi:MAG: membrane protein [Chitinophagales bacterium]|nr:MAG: membrane protein [Chitinophagales bacterium]